MKHALVTGGSGTLGNAICRQLAADGHHVIVHANSRLEQAERIAHEIVAGGGSAVAAAFDVANQGETLAALEKLSEQAPIQIVVNNAGIADDAVMPAMSVDQWRRVIDVSLNGFFHVTQPLLLPMMRTRWGRIVNISSAAALAGTRGQANYAAAKAGLHGATKALALEVATRGITVNVVAPGIIESPMAASAFPQDLIDRIVPMKRAGTPEEVAYLVSFLVSERASYISGQVISINGAMI